MRERSELRRLGTIDRCFGIAMSDQIARMLLLLERHPHVLYMAVHTRRFYAPAFFGGLPKAMRPPL
jgi:hypothetical protein